MLGNEQGMDGRDGETRHETAPVAPRQQNARKVTLDARHADKKQEEGTSQGVSDKVEFR